MCKQGGWILCEKAVNSRLVHFQGSLASNVTHGVAPLHISIGGFVQPREIVCCAAHYVTWLRKTFNRDVKGAVPL